MILTGRTTEELVRVLKGLDEPAYRGRQVAEWIYKRSARSSDEMTSLPARLREKLKAEFKHPPLNPVQTSESDDGTTKFLLETQDGNRVEAVFLPYEDRRTLCVSTQVGCAMDCSFCATAIGGLTRDLSAGEIVDQVLCVQGAKGERISNVVYMGMGEPLANYSNTVESIRLLVDEVGISPRRISVSTVGLPGAIRRLSEEGLPVTLAVSIHAPNDEIRAKIMPAARLHPLKELLDACRLWTKQTRRKMTFEYLLLDGVNDDIACARELAKVLDGLLANVNVIPYNHVEGRGQFQRPERSRIDRFKEELDRLGVVVTERMRKGNPIDAACGQLRHQAEQGRRIFSPSDRIL